MKKSPIKQKWNKIKIYHNNPKCPYFIQGDKKYEKGKKLCRICYVKDKK